MAQGGGTGRSTAIVLFTDLVGSTELRSRLGEQAGEELRRKHDALVTGAIEANRGRVVKSLGDGVMATFAGASDAVGAAIAIQQAIDRHNRSGPPLAVRIGISAGDVTFKAADCFGTPVIEAARLCAAAEGGQILAAEVIRWLAGAGYEFTQLGARQLKGLPSPVPTVEVGWEPAAVSSVPLPALLTDIGRIFVAREQEVERLRQLWKEVAAGERRVALLAGEPGVGKTRLAAELAAQAHEEGGLVLAGRCDEDLGVPYQPFVEALRHYVTTRPSYTSVATGANWRAWCPSWPSGCPAWRHRWSRTRRPSATASSTPWPPGWRRRKSPSCWCSTTSSGRRSRRCCSCATSCGRPTPGRC